MFEKIKFYTSRNKVTYRGENISVSFSDLHALLICKKKNILLFLGPCSNPNADILCKLNMKNIYRLFLKEEKSKSFLSPLGSSNPLFIRISN